jgi:hypothetical protein
VDHTDFDDFSMELVGLGQVFEFNGSNCSKLTRIGIELCDSLGMVNTLDLSSSVIDGDGFKRLETLPALTYLRLAHCSQLQAVEILKGTFKSLGTLCLFSCENLRKMVVSGVSSLKELDLSWCKRLFSVEVSNAQNLTVLDLGRTTSLTNVVLRSLAIFSTLDISTRTHSIVIDLFDLPQFCTLWHPQAFSSKQVLTWIKKQEKMGIKLVAK